MSTSRCYLPSPGPNGRRMYGFGFPQKDERCLMAVVMPGAGDGFEHQCRRRHGWGQHGRLCYQHAKMVDRLARGGRP